METRLLDYSEFKKTQSNPTRLTSGEPSINFWDYVESIPVEDFQEFDCRAGNVSHVYKMDNGYQHILINSEYQGVAMVVVINDEANTIFGHYLLNINPPGTRRPDPDVGS